MKKKPMRFRQALFWDVDPKTIDPEKHARYIIERVLDFGRDSEVKWVFQHYPVSSIKKTVDNSREMHAKSRELWKSICQSK